MATPTTTTPPPSTKRVLVSKANTTIVVVTAIAAFITVFSLVATKTLISEAMYQNRVASAGRQTLTQLKSDITASKALVSSYQSFDSASQNIIGGSNTGTTANDGPNSKIVLDALPSSYDFPALATSLEKIITNRGLTIQSIQGTDDEVNQQNVKGSGSPVAVAMPFQISVDGNYTAIQGLINDFQNSIRPFQIQTINLSGDESDLTLSMTAQTFYQPQKDLNISTEVVK